MDVSMKKIILLLFTSTLLLTGLRAQDADSLKIRPVSLGVLLQANYAGEDMYIAEPGLSAYPGFGVELRGFIDCHLTRQFSIEVQAILCLQNGSYVSTDKDLGFVFWHKSPINYLADMRLWGIDIPIFATWSLQAGTGHVRLGAGFFTHVTFNAWSPGDKDFVTPYNRVVPGAESPSGKPRYWLHDSHAGLGFQVGYEFACGLQINLGLKGSVIDIINYESKNDYARPYKMTLGVGWHF